MPAAPAVVLVDPLSGDATAWVLPERSVSAMVSPDGSAVFWEAPPPGAADRDVTARWHLLLTEDGSNRELEATSPPLAISPVTGAFVANTEASDAGRSGPAIFDADGSPLRALPAHGAHYGPAWSPVDTALAHAGFDAGRDGDPNTVTLYVLPAIDAAPVVILQEPIPAHSPFAIAWSRDGRRLAVVTADRVRVFGQDGVQLWEANGSFQGNPRWSPAGLLHVYGSAPSEPGVDERVLPYAYLFNASGEPMFRVRWFASCAGDPWVFAGSGIRDGRHVVLWTGMLRDLGAERARDAMPPPNVQAVSLRWREDDEGSWRLSSVSGDAGEPLLTVAPKPGRFPLDQAWTADGRYVFSTVPSASQVACGEGWTAPRETPTVERPDDWRVQ